ncbi:MAG TPA: patatin-like phospholipase family protein, partial [Alphaproteobacteria bacterium]|nr:patatin-like phospholipase family protein [Alphaproteobacteria bacterium]
MVAANNSGARRALTVDEVVIEEQKLLGEDKDLWALCLSGGGIRSATFSLGVLQGLAQKGLLEKFHYLSTVSGGG